MLRSFSMDKAITNIASKTYNPKNLKKNSMIAFVLTRETLFKVVEYKRSDVISW